MGTRFRIRRMLALALVLTLVPATLARANQAYDKVAAAWAQAGGHLDPCAFTQAQLEAALVGIPKAIRNVVPDLRRAMREGIKTHQRGDCAGVKPTGGTGTTAPGGGVAPPPETTTTPTTPSTSSVPGGAATPTQPGATTPAPVTPTTTAPAPAAQQPASSGGGHRDRTPLVIAAAALGALALLALGLGSWARLRGWDPNWVARARHAWGEAGFRTTTTWSEFTDWLRLGR